MKSFTAKEFSRCPAKVYEAAREDGCVEITHDRFSGVFRMEHLKRLVTEQEIRESQAFVDGYKKAPN